MAGTCQLQLLHPGWLILDFDDYEATVIDEEYLHDSRLEECNQKIVLAIQKDPNSPSLESVSSYNYCEHSLYIF